MLRHEHLLRHSHVHIHTHLHLRAISTHGHLHTICNVHGSSVHVVCEIRILAMRKLLMLLLGMLLLLLLLMWLLGLLMVLLLLLLLLLLHHHRHHEPLLLAGISKLSLLVDRALWAHHHGRLAGDLTFQWELQWKLWLAHLWLKLAKLHAQSFLLLPLLCKQQMVVVGGQGGWRTLIFRLEHIPKDLPPLEQKALRSIHAQGQTRQMVLFQELVGLLARCQGHEGQGLGGQVGLVVRNRRNIGLAHKQTGRLGQGVFDQEIVDVSIQELFGQCHAGVQHTSGQVHESMAYRRGGGIDGCFCVAELTRGVQRHGARSPFRVYLRRALVAHKQGAVVVVY